MGLSYKEAIYKTVIGPPIEIKPDKLIGFPDWENMPVCGGVGTLDEIAKNMRERNSNKTRSYSPRVITLTESEDPKKPRYPIPREHVKVLNGPPSDNRFTLEDYAETILELESQFPNISFDKIPESLREKKLWNVYYRRISKDLGIDNRIAA